MIKNVNQLATVIISYSICQSQIFVFCQKKQETEIPNQRIIKITAPVHGGFEPVKVNLVYQSLPQGGVRFQLPSHKPKLPKMFKNFMKLTEYKLIKLRVCC